MLVKFIKSIIFILLLALAFFLGVKNSYRFELGQEAYFKNTPNSDVDLPVRSDELLEQDINAPMIIEETISPNNEDIEIMEPLPEDGVMEMQIEQQPVVVDGVNVDNFEVNEIQEVIMPLDQEQSPVAPQTPESSTTAPKQPASGE